MEINKESSLLMIFLITISSAILTWTIGSSIGISNPVESAIMMYGFSFTISGLGWFLYVMRDTTKGRFYNNPNYQENEIEFNVRIGRGPWEKRYAEIEGKKLKIINRNLTSIDLSPLRLHPEIVLIDLSLNRLSQINLEPLEACRNLSILNLTSNEFVQIDLDPLSNCLSLKYLDLSNNKLTEINLEPLAACSNLDTLDLGGNYFGSIDLKPLRSCTQIECLTIDGTNIQSINLKPLESCKSLEHLILNDSRIKRLDITPLFKCSKLDLLDIDFIELTASSSIKNQDWPKGIAQYRERITLLKS